jgi:uncharacterized protein YeaC (DUF1315 family)
MGITRNILIKNKTFQTTTQEIMLGKVPSGYTQKKKQSTRTLSLVIHRVRFKKTLQKKKHISIQRGGLKLSKTINFGGKLS